METLNKLLDSLSPNTNADLPETPQEASGGLLNKLWDKLSPSKEPPQYSRDTGIRTIDNKFNSVLNRLVMAESQGKQFDKEGNLLTSNKGAEGITQVMPATGRDPGFGVEPMKNKSKEEFLRFGGDYLKAMLNEFNGDYEKAIAAYNAGHANVKRAIEKGGKNWKDYLPKKEETLPYLKKILGGDQAQFSGESTKPMNQQEDEQAFKFTLADAAKKGLLSQEGRDAYRKKIFEEHKKIFNSLSKKEQDSYPSTYGSYMKKEHPEEYAMLDFLDYKLKGMTERQITAIGLDTPFSVGQTRGEGVGGYVYVNNPDRAFITHLGDVNTAVHEKEHLTTQRKKTEEGALGIGTIGRSGEPFPQFYRDLLSKGMGKIQEDPILKKVFTAANSLDWMSETLSNIAAYESSLPNGVGLNESEFGKKLEKDYGKEQASKIIEQIQAYTLTDRGRIAKSDFEFDKAKIDKNTSYARQMYQYLKQKFGD